MAGLYAAAEHQGTSLESVRSGSHLRAAIQVQYCTGDPGHRCDLYRPENPEADLQGQEITSYLRTQIV